MKPKGWVKEPRRHSLASKGVRTTIKEKPVIILKDDFYDSRNKEDRERFILIAEKNLKGEVKKLIDEQGYSEKEAELKVLRQNYPRFIKEINDSEKDKEQKLLEIEELTEIIR